MCVCVYNKRSVTLMIVEEEEEKSPFEAGEGAAATASSRLVVSAMVPASVPAPVPVAALTSSFFFVPPLLSLQPLQPASS